MEKEQLPNWIDKFMGDIHNHLVKLPDSPDHILIILKGHLLVEQEVNGLLEVTVPNPKPLRIRDSNPPKFAHKLSLLKALIPKPKPVRNLWDVVKGLNDLRNDLAHELSPENVEGKIDKFVTDVFNAFGSPKSFPKKDRGERLRQSIVLIVHRLTCLTNL